uniref:ZinT/AdcA family metal-binding protein n=1 Tax=Anaerococcus mediterraneensis TaxID=1870984 RepID=UPI000930A713|nr:ZinT/AdcA family metal-binding protein [Anaerococcus mediterraneensis]
MKTNKKFGLVALLSLGLIMAACQNDSAKVETKEETKVEEPAKAEESKEKEETKEETKVEESQDQVSMADWEGQWNDMGGYLEKAEIQEAFKTLAEKENTDEASAKEAYLKKRKCDFGGLEIAGDHVKFLKEFPDAKGEVIGEADYTFKEKIEVEHGGHKLEWDVFEANSEDAPYKVLLMMPIHGEESLTHFHMRYGDDKDSLLKEEGWYPTFVKPSSTDAQIIDEITE